MKRFLNVLCIFFFSLSTLSAYGYGSWFLTVENNSDHFYGIQISEPDTQCWSFYDDLKQKQWIQPHSSRIFQTYEVNTFLKCWVSQHWITFYGFMPDVKDSSVNYFSFHNMVDTFWSIEVKQPDGKYKNDLVANPYKHKKNAYFTMTIDSNAYIDLFLEVDAQTGLN